MALAREMKRRGKAAIAPMIFLAITAYFGWSATQGAHGLIAQSQREDLLHQANAEHDAAVTERDTWQQRVAGLQANHLDPDTLDERARAMLNMANPNDIIVPYGPKDRVF